VIKERALKTASNQAQVDPETEGKE
jgi:hypothetical protein